MEPVNAQVTAPSHLMVNMSIALATITAKSSQTESDVDLVLLLPPHLRIKGILRVSVPTEQHSTLPSGHFPAMTPRKSEIPLELASPAVQDLKATEMEAAHALT